MNQGYFSCGNLGTVSIDSGCSVPFFQSLIIILYLIYRAFVVKRKLIRGSKSAKSIVLDEADRIC
jgi:hypothetical protein